VGVFDFLRPQKTLERRNREVVEMLLDYYVPHATRLASDLGPDDDGNPLVPVLIASAMSFRTPALVGAVVFAEREYAPWNIRVLSKDDFFSLGTFLAWQLRASFDALFVDVYEDAEDRAIASKMLDGLTRTIFPSSEYLDVLMGLIGEAEPDLGEGYVLARGTCEILHFREPSSQQIASVREYMAGLYALAVRETTGDVLEAIRRSA